MREEWEETAEEFERRRQAFQSEWHRTFLLIGMPGFLLFGLSLFIEAPWGIVITILGFGMFAGALARGALLMHGGRRCPVCGEVQALGIEIPYRTCSGCGARLSRGARDSV